MPLPRFKSNALFLAATLALGLGGCQSPWSAASGALSSQTPPVADDEAVHQVDALPGTTTADRDQAMVDVLDQLREVGEIDPAAQQKLVERLQATEPEMWPLVAQQFRASLAYHEQLVSKPAPSAHVSEHVAGNEAPAVIPLPNTDEEDSSSPEAVASLPWPDVPPASAAVAPADPKTRQSTAVATPPPHTAIQASCESTAADVRHVTPAIMRIPADASEKHPGPLPEGEGDFVATGALPKGDGESPDWQQLVEQAAADLSRRANDSPQSTAEVHQHVSLRMLQLLAGNTEEALRPIPNVSPTEQDYWSSQLFALATYLDHHVQPDDKRRAAAGAVHLDEALADLRELGSLTLRNLTFCKKIYAYGAYEPYESTNFAAGQQVSLYAEVENYHSESTEKGYTTTLGTSYEILNAKDERVDGGAFPDVEDCCRSRRRDFHIQYGLALPKNLTPGEYRLQLVVKDRRSDKIGEASVAFNVGKRP